MMMPTHRLIAAAAFVLLPVAGLSILDARLGLLVYFISGCFAAVVAADMVLSARRGATVQLDLPGIFRFSQGRDAEIRMAVRKSGTASVRIVIGLPFPDEIHTWEDTVETLLGNDTARVDIRWKCRPNKRGRYLIPYCYVSTDSILKLWMIRRTVPIDCEIQVYPNMLKDQKQLKGLFQKGGLGLHVQRKIGKGREFEQLREYLPGDSFEDICWKATARRRHPVTKIFQIEKHQQVYVILDTSRLSTRDAGFLDERRLRTRLANGEGRTTICDRFISGALVMGLAAEMQGDQFGLLTFADKPDIFLKAGGGRAHFNACRDALYMLAPKPVAPDFEELFTFIASRIRQRAFLIFLTNLDDPVLSESFVKNVHILSKRHLIFVNMFRPPGAMPLFSDDNVASVDGIYQHLMGHVLSESLKETDRYLRKHGVGMGLLDDEHMCRQLVSRYAEIKQRQVL